MTPSLTDVIGDKDLVTFLSAAVSTYAGVLKRHALNARRNASIHPAVEVNADTRFGSDGEIIIEAGCRLRKYAVIAPSGGHIHVGQNSFLNVFATLIGHGGIDIGENVLIGPHSTVVAANHTYDDADVTIDAQEISKEGVEIHDDVWIGANCTILDGVTVGEGSVVAAGSVVTKSVPEYSVVAGVPAEQIETR